MSDSDDVDSIDSAEVVKPKRRKRKKNKDPNRPKRNMSAFFLYSNANRARVKADNPDAKFGDIVSRLFVDFDCCLVKLANLPAAGHWCFAVIRMARRLGIDAADYFGAVVGWGSPARCLRLSINLVKR